MHIHPIISALRHHVLTVALIVVEVALTCAVVSNLLFIVTQRVEWSSMATGVQDESLIWVRTNLLKPDIDSSALQAADLQELRGIPGVKAAVLVNTLPVTPVGRQADISVDPGRTNHGISSNLFLGSPGFMDAAGIKVAEGRSFNDGDYVDFRGADAPSPSTAIVTRELADRLWPGRSPLGQHFYLGPGARTPSEVVGVVDHLLRSNVISPSGSGNVVLLPATKFDGGFYLLQVDPSSKRQVLRAIPQTLDKVESNRLIIKNEAYSDTVSEYFRGDRSLAILLMVIVLVFMGVTAVGIVGLSSFWVQRRRRQIGVRRALGARRNDIILYFLAENAAIVATGAVIGMVLAVLASHWLMTHYEVPRLPFTWVVAGGLLLLAVGQASVIGPALRAARVSPQEATRG
ncbi:ABC transporter permease [Luteibacter jiangsuensis]